MSTSVQIRINEARHHLRHFLKGSRINPSKANTIVTQEIRKVRTIVINTVSRLTGLPRSQTRRRVFVSRGRTYNNSKLKWKYAQVKTKGKGQIIHAGRLKPRRAGRGKNAGINVAGKHLPTGFFWNPKGRVLVRDNKRLYTRDSRGEIKAVRATHLGKPSIFQIYKTSGKRIELGLTSRVSRRIIKEAIRTTKPGAGV